MMPHDKLLIDNVDAIELKRVLKTRLVESLKQKEESYQQQQQQYTLNSSQIIADQTSKIHIRSQIKNETKIFQLNFCLFSQKQRSKLYKNPRIRFKIIKLENQIKNNNHYKLTDKKISRKLMLNKKLQF
ncbi:unnamed protein product [Paramecium sonneborni]|uniref:Uncharacterized protein n=1 Tax=Paramecium sonneborni TaxID=65129 RepID=A0A8S1NXI5_9CILI|nr:unnamed protein product [Paramecium sonneborni]